jgi:hypothetical protein
MPLARGQLVEQMIQFAPENSKAIPLFAGSRIGLIPDRRVQIIAPPGSTQPTVRKAVTSSLEEPISASQRAVVYNTSMQAYGLLSGEITFAAQSGFDPRSLGLGSAAGPRPLGPPDLYVLNVTSGSEFVRIFTLLKNARGVKWVEPSVEYIPEAIE